MPDDVGRMDRRVNIMRRVQVPDGMGGSKGTSWRLYRAEWAGVKDISWMRGQIGGGEISASMQSYKIPYDENINTRDFCIEDGGYRYIPFAIKEEKDEQFQLFMWLQCRGSRVETT